MASIPRLSNIGISALRAAQTSLNATSHNIANVNTEGYTRQRVNLETATPQVLGGFHLGTGVSIASIDRVFSETINAQVQVHTSATADAQKFLQLVSSIDNVLADPATGLSPALDGFFSAAQGVADDPGSGVQRNVLLSESGTLSRRFQLLDNRLNEINSLVNSEISSAVDELNSLAGSIAELNRQISTANVRLGPPNDLLDKRDQLVLKIGELVDVSTVELDDRSINVVVGGSHGLVLSTQVNSLQTSPGEFDASQMEVANGAGFRISSFLNGGGLGAALRFRTEVLEPAENSLDRVAAGLSETFNAQHQLGLDLNGGLGGNFFTSAAPGVIASADNGGTGAVTAARTDVNAITTSNYTLSFDGGNAYTLSRDSDGQTFAIDTGGTSPFTTAAIDGVTLTITAGASIGDRFQMRPAADSADGFGVAITSAAQIAAASPVRADSAVTNGGSGAISALAVNSVVNLPLTGAPVAGQLSVTFNSATNDLTLVPDPLGESPLAFDPSTESGGKSFTVLGGDVSFTFSGTPVNGDSFSLVHNSGGVSDNRNMLALTNLQSALTLGGSSVSIQGAYSEFVTSVGGQTRDAQISETAFSALLDQATADRDSVSGVNLDEEAADLVRFQQAYQASARLLSVVDELFQTLISSVR